LSWPLQFPLKENHKEECADVVQVSISSTFFALFFCQYFGAKNYKAAQSAFTQNFATKMRFHMKNACVKR